jgi:predicted ATP pyrophosphatase (TIGR00289 family)
MFHTPNAELTKKQAELMGLPIIVGRTKGVKEKELEDLKIIVKEAKIKFGADTLVTGATASNYQRVRIEKICKELGLKHIAPLWEKDPEHLLRKMVNTMKIMIVGVAGLPKEWLGEILTDELIEKLKDEHMKNGIHLLGEGGEYESLVLNCPLFSRELKVRGKPHWDGMAGWYEVEVV